MIFGPKLIPKVLNGTKTVTRRKVKPAHGDECPYAVKRTYAVQKARRNNAGRGGPEIARIRVMSTRREHILDLTLDDARAEGFASVDGFFEYWDSINGGSGPRDIDVWVIEFEIAPTDRPRLMPEEHGRKIAGKPQYVSSRNAAMEGGDPGEAVPEDYQRQLTAEVQESNRQMQLLKLAEARHAVGVLSSLGDARMQRHARALERQIDAAERDVAA